MARLLRGIRILRILLKKDFFLHNDDYSVFDKNFLNILGTGYDGVFPIDVGWDAAYVPELLSDYGKNSSICDAAYGHIGIIRSNGRYFAYATTLIPADITKTKFSKKSSFCLPRLSSIEKRPRDLLFCFFLLFFIKPI